MEYSEHKPIYLQNVDLMQEKILRGDWREEERIPSVREMGSMVGVNPNTIARVYEHLQGMEIIYNKRGIGYFVSADAPERILQMQREEFLKNELPAVVKKMKLLGISLEVLKNDL